MSAILVQDGLAKNHVWTTTTYIKNKQSKSKNTIHTSTPRPDRF